jgi:hypothetical protein
MEKRIVINDKNDLKKFYKNLKYYRSFLFYCTKFKSDNDDIKNIIKALNIKKRTKRIKYIYETACNEIDDYNKTLSDNICCFKKDICLTNTKYGCCRKCSNLGSKGCTTSNLTCKLFFCNKVCDKYKVLTFDDVKILKCLSFRNQIIVKHNYFTKKEDYLMDLYIGSILILFIRYFYRSIKHRINKKTKK